MNSFLDTITSINDTLNTIVWSRLGVWLLIAVGVIMTCVTGFFQVTHIGHWLKKTIGSLGDNKVKGHTGEKASISQFQALCTALAATVGVGNIAGVAAAIMTGGPGAVFWMWVAAFFGMMTNYSENILGIYFRRKNKQGEWSGGAMYYLQDGLGSKKGMKTVGKVLAVAFSVFAVFASFGIGNMGQINKIVVNFTTAFNIRPLSDVILYTSEDGASVNLYMLIMGIVLMILIGLIVIGGLQRIARVAETIVPFMVVAFVLGSLVIILKNAAHIGSAFSAIFGGAFTAKAAWGAAGGLTVKQVITMGCKRGVFSNEAGLGSSVMVHSNSNVIEPVKQGLWGIFEVFADTFIVCTMTALTVLTSGVIDLNTGIAVTDSDSTLVAEAFNTVFKIGDFELGRCFIALAILLFAFTTVLGWSHYGSKAVEYLAGDHTGAVKVYKVIFVIMTLSGAVLTSSLAWDISDTFNGMMMIPNLIGVVFLSPLVMKITKSYIERRIRNNKDAEPVLSFFPELNAENAKRIKETGDD
ncbi:MAG: alanine:cation symporter family protein [Oscillospiraceae bacterium]|nr:alanine:cation symporter family protein [Oscillospiraceae bacterium]